MRPVNRTWVAFALGVPALAYGGGDHDAAHACNAGRLFANAETAAGGPLRARLPAPDHANVVLLYGAEQMGSLDACGCPKEGLRGSLARVESYRAALAARDRDTPIVLLNAGNWLDDTIGYDDRLRADTIVANTWMLKGLAAGGWDVANVGFRDLPHLVYVTKAFPDIAVSANVRPDDAKAAAPARWKLIERGGVKVAVTGISTEGMSFLQPEGWTYHDPIAALREVVPEMDAQADLVVVLAYAPGPLAQRIVDGVPGIDVMIESGEFKERWDPFVENGAVWVRAFYRTEKLGELRLHVAEDRVACALDRKIELDGQIPDDRALERMNDAASEEVQRVQQELFGTW